MGLTEGGTRWSGADPVEFVRWVETIHSRVEVQCRATTNGFDSNLHRRTSELSQETGWLGGTRLVTSTEPLLHRPRRQPLLPSLLLREIGGEMCHDVS